MFTGLITDVGEVVRVAQTGAGREFTIAVPWSDVAVGESIAVDGVCLTATRLADGEFSVAAVGTTLDCTTLGSWRAGRRVNLERALRASDRLGGHIVQGHVDGVAEIGEARSESDALLLDVAVWDGAEAMCVPKGSIALDGVSLTIFGVPAPRVVTVSLIEHTRRHTTLGERRVGEQVNVELDVIAKYVRQLAAPWASVTSEIR